MTPSIGIRRALSATWTRRVAPSARPQADREVRVPGPLDPAAAAARLAASGVFPSYVVYERDGEWWVAGGALGEVVLDAGQVRSRWQNSEVVRSWSGSPFAAVQAALAGLPGGGRRAFGWAAFELAPRSPGRPSVGVLLDLLIPHTEVRIRRNGATARSHSRGTAAQVRELLAEPAEPSVGVVTPVDVERDRDAYQAAVALAVEEIRRGQLQKVVLSRPVPVRFPVDLVGTYLLGRRRNTPARSFLLQLGGRRAAGFSPETVVEVSAGGQVTAQALAGTRPLGLGEAQDALLREQLLTDPKEVFEHVISVKAVHDELLELCAPGSVGVRELMAVRRRGTVQHLGSTVTGRLAGGRSAWDALAALFPAVTASGIPRAAACERIARLEPSPRDLYGGAVLMIGDDGALDAALVLRAIVESAGAAWLRAGAGIVATSDPAKEYRETCDKLAGVALSVVRATAASTGPATATGGVAGWPGAARHASSWPQDAAVPGAELRLRTTRSLRR